MLPLLALIVGLVVGLLWHGSIPDVYWPYVAVLILAMIDALTYGLAMYARKVYDQRLVYLSLFGNFLLAVCITALGEQIGLQLYLCPFFAFGVRIFQNFGRASGAFLEAMDQRNIRRLIAREEKRRRAREAEAEDQVAAAERREGRLRKEPHRDASSSSSSSSAAAGVAARKGKEASAGRNRGSGIAPGRRERLLRKASEQRALAQSARAELDRRHKEAEQSSRRVTAAPSRAADGTSSSRGGQGGRAADAYLENEAARALKEKFFYEKDSTFRFEALKDEVLDVQERRRPK